MLALLPFAAAGQLSALQWTRAANICAWKSSARARCSNSWRPLGGAAVGTCQWLSLDCYHMYVAQQLAEVTWRCCSGHVPMAVTGIMSLALKQLVEATWRCCSGHVPMVVIGVLLHAGQQLVEATWRCCNGRLITAAPNFIIEPQVLITIYTHLYCLLFSSCALQILTPRYRSLTSATNSNNNKTEACRARYQRGAPNAQVV